MKFDYSRSEEIPVHKPVKVKVMNHIVEVVSVQNKNNGFQNLKKLSKTEYMLKDTGEILEYNLGENRGQNVAGLKDTFRRIRDLINNNFTGAGNEMHLTLTYKENMTDPKRLYTDFEKFWKRYKYKYGTNIDYLSVIEPQGRGAWHCHVLIRHNEQDRVFIPSKELENIWGNGFIKVRSMKGVDNIGAYLSAYLGDAELTKENVTEVIRNKSEIKQVTVQGKEKSIIKGGRLHLYPPGMNLYRHSKGILPPVVQEIQYQELKRIVKNATPDYSRTLTIIDDEQNKILNRVTYENYNTKRLNIETRKV